MNRVYTFVAMLAAVLFMASCINATQPREESEYKKQNDAFVKKVEKGTEYTKLLFLNTTEPIYYKSLAKGDSKVHPYQDSEVRIQIAGRLISGEVFQGSTSLVSRVNGLIPGVQYALQSMNVGDKWEIVVPYMLGYGMYGKGPTLPGYSTLIFTLELQEVVKQ